MLSSIFVGTAPLLIFVAKTTLVLIAALVATTILRRTTAGERHLVWLAALVGILALPLVARIPALQIGVLPSRLATVERFAANVSAPDAVVIAPPPLAALPAPAPAAPAAPAATPAVEIVPPPADAPSGGVTLSRSEILASPLQIVAMVWAAVAFSLLGWLVFGAFQVRRIVRDGLELSSPDWTTPLCEVADRIDLEQPPRLVISDRIEMAFACRALNPTIVLPAAAESWSDERRRAVLFHELAHVKRHDLVAHALGRIACALYWFHPLVWAAARNLRAESEKACDDLVLSCGARPSEYAQHLLDMVTSVRRHDSPVMALPMARKKEFEGRMLAILDPAIRRAAPGRLQAAGTVATIAALSLTIAAVSPAAPASVDAVASAPMTAPAQDTIRRRQTAPRRDDVDTAVMNRVPSNAGKGGVVDSDAIARVAAQGVADVLKDDKVAKQFGGFAADIASLTIRSMALGTHALGRKAQVADTGRIALLERVLTTDTDAGVRRAAAWALNDIQTSGAVDALTRALASDSDESVRETSAWSLAEADNQQSVNALATALLRDRSAKVRHTAAWALGNSDCCQATDALVSAISDSDPDVRHVAIWALGNSDLHRAPTALVNALSDNSTRVREVAAWALGQIEDTTAARPLARAFETESEPKVKTALLWALTHLDHVPTSVVEAAMKSSDPEVRRRGVAMLSGHDASWPWPWPWPWPRPNP